MRALIIEHDAISPPGSIGDALRRRGFDFHEFVVVTDAENDLGAAETVFPDLAGYDCVVAMGAPWSVYDPRVRPWVEKELALLRDADRCGIPVLGVCFGGQLLAQAHGGSVYRAAQPEFGWCPVTVLDDSFLDVGPWFQWHSDRWDLPPGATELAVSDSTPQAFVLRRNLAVQFHPEITPEILTSWLAQEVPDGHRADDLLARTLECQPQAAHRADRVVEVFLSRVATA